MPFDGFLVGDLCLCSSGWNWILSLKGSAMFINVCFGVSLGLVCLWTACLLLCKLCPYFVEGWRKAFVTGAYWSLGGGLVLVLRLFGRAS